MRLSASCCFSAATTAFDAGGPEVMTHRQMIEQIAALLGRRPRIVEVPVLTPTLSALWLESCGRMVNLRAEIDIDVPHSPRSGCRTTA